MTFMNDNDFMIEMTEEELNAINGAGNYGFSDCGDCGFTTLPSIPSCAFCGCSTCGFTSVPFISAYSNEVSHSLVYNVSYAANTLQKTSYFTLIN